MTLSGPSLSDYVYVFTSVCRYAWIPVCKLPYSCQDVNVFTMINNLIWTSFNSGWVITCNYWVDVKRYLVWKQSEANRKNEAKQKVWMDFLNLLSRNVNMYISPTVVYRVSFDTNWENLFKNIGKSCHLILGEPSFLFMFALSFNSFKACFKRPRKGKIWLSWKPSAAS